VSTGTMIEVISPGAVKAVTVTSEVSSVPALVMNCLPPSITHSSPSSRALVVVAPYTSDPPPASVSPNPPSRSPLASSGSHRRFCSSVPNSAIGAAPSPTPASRVMPTDWSTRPSSSIARHSVR
jgi:hypothetical protein